MASYEEWTAALGEYFFRPEQRGRVVALAVDPEVLRQIAQDHELCVTSSTEEEAIADFARAVAEDVALRGWDSDPAVSGVYPSALGKCSLFALAFSLTHRNVGESGRPAFWREVWSLLLNATGDPPDSSSIPAGLPGPDPFRLTGPAFQELWRTGLAAWANHIEAGRWGRVALPECRSGPSCHVHLVQSQAGLRRLDLNRSGALFGAAGLRPGEALSEGELWNRLKPHFGRPALLLPPAHAVVSDPARRKLAKAQLAAAFQKWNGEDIAERGEHSVPRLRLRVWLRIESGSLHGGVLECRADGSDHPYEAPLGDLLASTSARVGGGYRRRGEVLLAAFEAFDELYVEQRQAMPGDRILLLVPLALLAEVEAWCEEVGKEPQHRTDLAEVPVGWEVFSLRVRDDLPLGVDHGRFGELLAPQAVRLIGGLRLGGRNQWMAGAGPWLEVLDARYRTAIEIDGEAIECRDGVVTLGEAPKLDEAGWHRISVGGREVKRLSVVEPTRATVEDTEAWVQADPTVWPASLPGFGLESSLTIDGPHVQVPEAVVNPGRAPSTRSWLAEAVAIARREAELDSVPKEANPLVRQLRQARLVIPRPWR